MIDVEKGQLRVNEQMESKKLNQKNRSFAFRALFYWGKCLGLNPITLTNGNEVVFSYVGLLYGCVISAIYSFVFYRALQERVHLALPGETPIAVIVDYLGMYWQFFDTTSSWLVFAFYQNRIKSIVDSFVNAENTSIKLGIPEDYAKYFREFGIFVTISNFLFMASLAFSIVMWNHYETFDPYLWTNFSMPPIVAFNVQILFIWGLKLAKRKFRRLNHEVKVLMEQDCSEANEGDLETSSGNLNNSCRDPDLLGYRIDMVSQLHRELRDVIRRIEEHFSLILLFATLDSLTYTTLDVYTVYFHIKTREKSVNGMDFIHVGAVSHWLICDVALLIGVSNICGATIYEANNTGNILHEMLNNRQTPADMPQVAKLDVLSLDLLQNRVTVSLLGLLCVDYCFIYKTTAKVTTFLTIMLQFDN